MIQEYEEILENCVSALRTCKKTIESVLGDDCRSNDDYKQYFHDMDNIIKEYCEVDYEQKRIQSAIEETSALFSDKENDYSKQVPQVYQEFLNKGHTSHDLKEHPIWKRLHRSKEVDQNETSCDRDCSLFMSQEFQPPVDPITKRLIKNPCRNKICGHVYEIESIKTYIENRKKNIRCPYIGCNNNNFKIQDLQRDEELKDDISDYNSQN